MKNRPILLLTIFSCSAVHATSITWNAQSLNKDMNYTSNWTPNIIPGSGDIAIFDSTIPGIQTNPTENVTSFSPFEFNFPNGASPFTFNFNSQSLAFQGTGITGTNTNTAIYITNTDNSTFFNYFLSFNGLEGTTGSSILTLSNSGTLLGDNSGMSINPITSFILADGPFTVASNGIITASNIGIDAATGTGNNSIATSEGSLLNFNQSFTAENSVSLSVSNSGTFSGSNSSSSNGIAVVNGSQLLSSGAFETGDNFNCTIQNSGTSSSVGVGGNNIGVVGAPQMLLNTTAVFGNNANITVSNTAVNSSNSTNSSNNNIGYLNDYQFIVVNSLQADDDFHLTVTNMGTDTSTGYGASQLAVLNSNSGTTGNLVCFAQDSLLGNGATITVSNSGHYSGTNTHGGPNVGSMNLGQVVFGTSPNLYTFTTGNDFNLTISNIGVDSGQGTGSDIVGNISTNQVTFYAVTSLGDSATITLSNSGNFSGDGSSTYLNVGSVGGCQLYSANTFQAGNNFTISATNTGTHTGSGVGDNFIGDLITGQQLSFNQDFVIGNNALITISNSAVNSSSTTSPNQTGSFMGYGKQLYVYGQLQAGNNLQIVITNSGFDDSTNAGGNYTGFMNNDTVDHTGSQIHIAGGVTLGSDASISLSNTGTFQGDNGGGNRTGSFSGQQLYSVEDFSAGDNFTITASNSGINNGSGQNNNTMGSVGSSQIDFGANCTLGNNASITLSNSGVNNDATGVSNTIGFINGSQLGVSGAFTAGENLLIYATNSSTNNGDDSNGVGYTNGAQIYFVESCIIDAGSSITATNSGIVTGSQIVFGNGFSILSGKAQIAVSNQGTVDAFGIDIQGTNTGGNADITLNNSSLYIEASSSTFTIGGVNGDPTSTLQSNPILIISTDSSTKAIFTGIVQDFPSMVSSLEKTGAGTQTLSGANTYSGSTTVQEGILIVNGSIVNDVQINSAGILKGNGSIGGTVTNTGTISPGESIGTLTVGSYVDNGGNYGVEVNGAGQSNLIDSLGAATLSSGEVLVSSADGTIEFQYPYTILVADGGVSGTFADATSANFITPILTYDANHVYLTILASLIDAADACNQYGVAENLDGISGPNAAQNLLISAIATSSQKEAQQSLESLSGFQYTNDVWLADISLRRLFRRLYDPIRAQVVACTDATACSDWSTWLETGYSFTNFNGSSAHKSLVNSVQATGGVEKSFCSNITIGLSGSYEYNHSNYRYGKGSRNSGYASTYALYRPAIFYTLLDLVYGNATNSVRRIIQASDLHYTAHGKANLNTLALYSETGFDIHAWSALFQPFLGIQYGNTWRQRLHERQDNGWALNIDKHNWSSTSSRLGFHLSNCLLSLDVAWNQLLSSGGNYTTGKFQQFGTPFHICGNHLDHFSIDYALTFMGTLYDTLKGYLELSGETWQHANTANITAGLDFSW